ncbi:MAG: hypothetical protein E7547_05920 [Ruminococcaceae bacterium]|nr:hypothetical protein [Oscillospiraceae bacterium]
MKTAAKKVFSIFLCAVMLVTSLSGLGVTASASDAEAEYSVYVYEMDVDGLYAEESVETHVLTGIAGETATLNAEDYLRTGFTFDEESSVTTATIQPDGSTVLCVYLARNKYRVTFDFSEGRNSDGENYVEYDFYYGSVITEPEYPIREGFCFEGWVDAEGNIGRVDYTMPAEDITFCAVWSAYQYNVCFDAYGGYYEDGTEIQVYTYDYGCEIDPYSIPMPVKDGYVFCGWSTDGTYEGISEIPRIMPCYDLTFYAVWKVNDYMVTWLVDGEEYVVELLPYASHIQEPSEVPEKIGYEFYGWLIEGSDTYFHDSPDMTMPAQDITFQAMFIRRTDIAYTVKKYFMGVDGTYSENSDETIQCLGTVEDMVVFDVAAESYEGFTVDMEKSITEAVIQGDGSTLLEIYYARNKYDVTINGEQNEYYYGEIIDEPDFPEVPEGYELYEWVNQNGEPIIFPYVVTAEETVIDPVFVPCVYTVVFESAGGCFPNGDTTIMAEYEYGTVIVFPEEPYREGYTFERWVSAENGETVHDSMTMPANNLVITAAWYINDYRIIMDDGDGNEWHVIHAMYGEEISEYIFSAPLPCKEGYTFRNWMNAETGEELDYSYLTMPACDLHLVAVWEINVYTATWMVEGIEVCVMDIPYMHEVTHPEPPARVGYVFEGWGIDGNIYESGSFNMPCENIVFEACFIPCDDTPYTIEVYEMMTDGCYPEEPTYIQVNIGTTDEKVSIYEANYIKEGFTVDESNSILSANIVADGSTVLRVYLARNVYTVEFDADDATEVTNYYYGSMIIAPEEPCKEGFRFDGWVDSDGNRVLFPIAMPAQSLRFTAVWVVEFYEVSWYDDGELCYSEQYEYGMEIELPPDPIKEGYVFMGWVDQYGNYPEFPFAVYEETRFEAIWSACEFTLTLFADGGIFSDNTSEKVYTLYYGDEIDIREPDPTREGYCFAGWTTEAGSIYASHLPSYMPAHDLTLYALWQVGEYTVTLDDGFGEILFAMQADYGEDLGILEYVKCPEREGYIFSHWEIAETGEAFTFPATMPAYDMTLKAVWDYGFYTVTWDTDEMQVVEEYQYGTEIIVPPEPYKEGYVFVGWTPAVPSVMPDYNLVFRAVWEPCEYTITYDFNGGLSWEGDYAVTYSYRYGDMIEYIEYPTREGCIFMGWEDENGYIVDVPATMPSYDMTLMAVWEYETYRLTYIVDGYEIAVQEMHYAEMIDYIMPPEKEGYTFVGWNSMEHGYQPDIMPACDLYLEAMWALNQYVIRWSVDGYVTEEVYEFGQEIIVPASPVKEGYLFAGWTPSVPANMPANDLVFEAMWEVAGDATYTVETYKMNTVGEYDKDVMVYNISSFGDVSVAPVVPLGFELNEEKSVLSGYVSADGDLVLEIYLDRLVFTFTTVVDGVSKSADYYYGSMVTEPLAPEKDGYKFIGWDAEIPSTMPAEDVTVTAQFEEKTEDDPETIDAPRIEIITPKTRTLSYGETVTLQVRTFNIPEGAQIKWTVEGDGLALEPSASRITCKVTSTSNGNAVVKVVVVDEKGNNLVGADGRPVSDSEHFYSEVNFISMILAFILEFFGIKL